MDVQPSKALRGSFKKIGEMLMKKDN